MKRGILVIILSLVLMSSIVSAGFFTGVWQDYLTGRVSKSLGNNQYIMHLFDKIQINEKTVQLVVSKRGYIKIRIDNESSQNIYYQNKINFKNFDIRYVNQFNCGSLSSFSCRSVQLEIISREIISSASCGTTDNEENCDSDGIDNDCDGIVDECCAELYNGVNIKEADRINIVFVGFDYRNKTKFIEHAKQAINYDGRSGGIGLMNLPVYRDNKNKFNFWYVNDILQPDVPQQPGQPAGSCIDNLICDSEKSKKYCEGLTNKYEVNLYNSAGFRPRAYFGGSSFIPVWGDNLNRYIFDHEFQHQFPRLADEYTEPNRGDWPSFIDEFGNIIWGGNCAPDINIAKLWWGDLVGQTGIGYYDGCSYVTGNYRPTTNSMMKEWIFNLGAVNERIISNELLQYSGIISNLEKSAIEIELIGNPHNISSYNINKISEVKFHNSIKKNKNKPYKIKIDLGEKSYEQGFDTKEYLISENYDETTNTIGGAEFKVINKSRVKIYIPIENNVKLNKLKKKFDVNGAEKEFNISIEKGNRIIKRIDYGNNIKSKII